MAAFVPLTFAAGEGYQFDWREEEVESAGVVQRVKAAHFRLTHSRQPFVMVFPREIQTMLFAAHDAAFHYFLAYAQSELIAECIFRPIMNTDSGST